MNIEEFDKQFDQFLEHKKDQIFSFRTLIEWKQNHYINSSIGFEDESEAYVALDMNKSLEVRIINFANANVHYLIYLIKLSHGDHIISHSNHHLPKYSNDNNNSEAKQSFSNTYNTKESIIGILKLVLTSVKLDIINDNIHIILHYLLEYDLYQLAEFVVEHPDNKLKSGINYCNNSLMNFMYRLTPCNPQPIFKLDLKYVEKYVTYLAVKRKFHISFYVRYCSISHKVGMTMKELFWEDIPEYEYSIDVEKYYNIIRIIISRIINQLQINDEDITYFLYVVEKLRRYKIFPFMVSYILDIDKAIFVSYNNPSGEIIKKAKLEFPKYLSMILVNPPRISWLLNYFTIVLNCDFPVGEAIMLTLPGRYFRKE